MNAWLGAQIFSWNVDWGEGSGLQTDDLGKLSAEFPVGCSHFTRSTLQCAISSHSPSLTHPSIIPGTMLDAIVICLASGSAVAVCPPIGSNSPPADRTLDKAHYFPRS